MGKIRVLLADDHQMVLDGIKEVLKNNAEIDVIGQVLNGEEVLDFVKKNLVDVVVLDINMPVMDGIKCARVLKKEYPKIKIIILTMFAQKSFAKEIFKIGIDGCLLKSNTGKDLKEAITRVMSDKSYFDLIQIFQDEDESHEKEHKLSPREIEIIRLLSDGLTSSQIADKLFLSEHTVKTHRKNILKKTNTNSAAELIQYALNFQII